MEPWQRRAVEVLFAHPLFTLTRRRLERGAEQRDVLVIDSADWVQVIPVLANGDLLMIRQWRYGSESVHLEFPGGLVDPGEDHATAAARELLEETGHRAASVRRLGELDPNPAIIDNRLSIWVAEGLERIGDPDGDEDEEIELVPVPAAEVPARIARGEIRHALMVATYFLWQLDQAK